jgi:hypothetical protein
MLNLRKNAKFGKMEKRSLISTWQEMPDGTPVNKDGRKARKKPWSG